MKVAKYSRELPFNPFPDRDRIYARISLDCEGDDLSTENTVVDVAPGRLNAYFRTNGLVNSYEFRVVTRHCFLQLCSSWLAASFGNALPITMRDVRRHDDVVILIEPPWPLDFRLLIRASSKADADKIMATLESQGPSDEQLNHRY